MDKEKELYKVVACFIVFREEFGSRMCMKLAEEQDELLTSYPKHDLLGRKPIFETAPEPQNILWENKHIEDSDHVWLKIRAFIIIFLLLLTSFAALIKFKNQQIEFQKNFPMVNCDILSDNYDL